MVETLKITKGGHILVSKEMLGKDCSSLLTGERNTEKGKFMVVVSFGGGMSADTKLCLRVRIAL